MTQLFEYPFESNYATVDGVRLHYLDEGQGPVIWLMHGNTSWSYLYRKMIRFMDERNTLCGGAVNLSGSRPGSGF